VADWSPKIQGIVDWFGQLQKVDVEGVPPALRAAGTEAEAGAGANRLRPDTPVDYPAKGELLGSAPERDGPFLKIPKILASEQE
jgi:aspartyl-tRNA(Asn)/glutamyl-tRNA(Gln) amidotransferase subunit C